MSEKIGRLFEIVQILLNEKNITAKKLSEHFEVSTRTIYRDIETLILTGVPIYSTKGVNGGIKLLDNFVMDKSLLSNKEQNEILYALQSLKATGIYNDDKTLLKLHSIFSKKKADDWIEIDFSRYGNNDNTFFENIKEAILNKNIIKFTYYNTKGENSERTVNPLKIWFKEKAWYLFAYCHNKKDIRQFKINRIKYITITNETFTTSIDDFDISYKNTTPYGSDIIVNIDKSQAYRVYDEFCYENITKKEDGDFEVVINNYENEWLYGYLLSFGEHIKIIKPKRIRDILLDKINKMQKNFITYP